MNSTELRNYASEQDAKAAESFDRCDTDGFLSQWVYGLSAGKARLQADIADNGGRAIFAGLYDGNRRVAAKAINGQFGMVWLLREDEAARYGRFVPYGTNSRKQRALGLSTRDEYAPAKADLRGTNATNVRACTVRTGDEWGQDSELIAD